jgi:outer membrane protein OmpA-like peptidoglycan-associated protein/Tol biopolymer transport system component
MKILIKAIVTSVFLLVLAQVHCQNNDIVTTNNAKQSLVIAQNLLSKGDNQKAIKQLKHTIKIKEDFAIAHRLLGKAYYDTGQFENAADALERSFDLDRKLSRAAFFEAGDSYLRLQGTEKAEYYLGIYQEMKGKRYANAEKESGLEKSYDLYYESKLNNLAYIESLDTTNTSIKIYPLTNVNSEDDEYLPSLSNDGRYLLFTREVDKVQEDIFITERTETGWGDANENPILINTSKNEGMAKFEPHNRKVYFAGCQRSPDRIDCDIYESEFKDGQLESETKADEKINSTAWDSQPSVTCDGKVLFFASTREGGIGGSDIWFSTKDEKGNWSYPQNAGVNINTEGDEEAPFIAKDGAHLYFTSNFHPGQGEGDFFVSTKENGHWGAPVNLGYPINSPGKELGLFVMDDTEHIYFASEREGGKGGLDIYFAQMPEISRPEKVFPVVLKVIDKTTKEIIPNQAVVVGYDKKNIKHTSDEEGNIYMCLQANKAYSYRISREGYKFYVEAHFLEEYILTAAQTLYLEIEPKQVKPEYEGEDRHTKTIVQVYFDVDSAEIPESDFEKLDRIARLINKYDDWDVNVIGFADNTGNKDYNYKLSQNRADTVIAYLATKCSQKIEQKINSSAQGAVNGNLTEEEKRQSRRVDVILSR